MARAVWQRTITDTAGNIKPGASIAFYDESTGAAAIPSTDRDGLIDAGNPIIADSSGFARCYLIGGRYRVVVTYGSESHEDRNVPVGTAAEYDIETLLARQEAQVRVATTVNITIATALNNGDVIDGITLATGNRVLVKNQTTKSQNGVYVVGVTPVRAADFDTYDEHAAAMIGVSEGTQANTLWRCIANIGGVLNTTDIEFALATIQSSVPGPQGVPGTDPGMLMTFDTDVVDADQGSGKIWTNNAVLTSATVLYVSKTNRAGSSIAAALARLDDSTTVAPKAEGLLTRTADGAQLSFTIGTVTDATNYVKIAISGVAGVAAFAAGNAISFQAYRVGDKGADGAGNVTATVDFGTDNRMIRSDLTGKNVQASAITVDDSGNMSGVGTLNTSGQITTNGNNVHISAAAPGLRLTQSGAAADNGLWFLDVLTQILYLRVVNDANTVSANVLAVTRSGTTPTLFTIVPPLQVTTIELGHATDTTLARSAAGKVSIEGKLICAVTDPNADRVMIWDDSAGDYVAATLNGGLLISGTTIFAVETFGIAASDETTALTTGTNKATFSLPYAFTVSAVYATLNTVSSSGVVTVDINEAGVSILSTKLTIDASEKTSGTAATAAVISDASIAAFAEIGIDIDTAGTGAKGLKIFIQGYR